MAPPSPASDFRPPSFSTSLESPGIRLLVWTTKTPELWAWWINTPPGLRAIPILQMRTQRIRGARNLPKDAQLGSGRPSLLCWDPSGKPFHRGSHRRKAPRGPSALRSESTREVWCAPGEKVLLSSRLSLSMKTHWGADSGAGRARWDRGGGLYHSGLLFPKWRGWF